MWIKWGREERCSLPQITWECFRLTATFNVFLIFMAILRILLLVLPVHTHQGFLLLFFAFSLPGFCLLSFIFDIYDSMIAFLHPPHFLSMRRSVTTLQQAQKASHHSP